jgi:hypothetical protein
MMGVSVLMASTLLNAVGAAAARGGRFADAAVETFQSRATNTWHQGFLLKPQESSSSGLDYQLAPLLLFVGQTNGAVSGNALTNLTLGTVTYDTKKVEFEPTTQAVYWSFETGNQPEGETGRMTYRWFQETQRGGTNRVQSQGIRLRLNAEGQPVVWEVLADSSGARLYYVSKSYAERIKSVEGGAVPAFSTPPPPEEASVLVRELDDGPVPMGPIVYIDPGTGDVVSVICRCMAAQVEGLVGSRSFELVPWRGKRGE